MRDTRVLSILICFFALLFSSSHIASASDEELAVASLQSLPGIFVVVEDLSSELAESGVSEDQLKADVEEKLRGAGVKVLSLTEYLRTPGFPHFSVCISAVKGGRGPSYTTIVVELNQGVYLERDPKIHQVLTTWSTGFVGAVGNLRQEQVFSIMDELVDEFIKAYLLANGKERDKNRKSPRRGYPL